MHDSKVNIIALHTSAINAERRVTLSHLAGVVGNNRSFPGKRAKIFYGVGKFICLYYLGSARKWLQPLFDQEINEKFQFNSSEITFVDVDGESIFTKFFLRTC